MMVMCSLHIIASKDFKWKVKEEAIIFALVTKEATLKSVFEYPPEMELVLR